MLYSSLTDKIIISLSVYKVKQIMVTLLYILIQKFTKTLKMLDL